MGALRYPSNTQGDLCQIFDRAGYPEITSHTLRRTVATLMDAAGLTARAEADQLGHGKVSMTTDHYFGRRKRSTGVAEVLEALHGAHRKGGVKDGPIMGLPRGKAPDLQGSAPSGTRTPNPLIKSQLLCLLS